MKIAALVVTCNRRHLLSKLIEDFNSQTQKPDAFIVVDNGSDDDTVEYIKTHFNNIQLIELKHNTGHMGGFEVGVRSALQQGYDAVLSVDDDARLRKDTLDNLLQAIDSDERLRESFIWCANVSFDERYFTEPVCIKVGDEWKVYHEFLPELQGKVYEAMGGANIGLYIPLSAIKNVGLPNADLVFNGEPEFKYRIQKEGYKLFYCFSSIIHHKRHKFYKIKLKGRTRYVCHSSSWRIYYEIRNLIYIDRTYKRRTFFRSILNSAIISTVKIYHSDNKIITTLNAFKAVYDGLRGKMGMRVHIPRPKTIE